MLSSQKSNVTNHGFAYHDSGLEIYCNSAWRSTLSWSNTYWNILASFYWKDNCRYREANSGIY